MGGCCSSADDKYAAPSQQPRAAQNGGVKPPPAPKAKANTPGAPPDFGLAQTHEIIKILGKGGEGETWLAREKATGHEVAIKLIRRPIPKPAIAVIKREIKIQADLGQGHLNIVSADEVILSKTHLGLVMEYVPGGNMVNYVTKKRETKHERGGLCLTEDEAHYFFLQLLSAVEYCHRNHVAHRDLKLDNTLLCLIHAGGNMVNYVTKKRETKHERGGLCLTEDEAHYFFLQLLSAVEYCHRNHVAHRDLKLDNTLLDSHSPPWLKVCDFGFAKHWQANSNMDTMRIGTPEYMGPELISSRTGYDGKKVDVWAAGVLLFVMLVGVFPFETQDDNFNNTAGLYDIWLQQIKTSW
ncbi:protein kinase domain-containing protein [Haematococcus lacustris]|uniref:Protein kinase domain-containing protein n=1 Tax=Haematococcus lacustris TaxID=44745 RepID=A0A699YFS8_HAELA|nr:protein kinase domain-containing protein [Haematococcus lacustris]